MRLIDANDLIDWFESLAHDDWNKGTGTTWARAFEESANMVDGAPTIDAVPVVRCRNCECWYPEEDDEYGHCRKHDFWTSESWFCADGERREDGKH